MDESLKLAEDKLREKRAESVETSSASSSTRPQPKTLDDLSLEELRTVLLRRMQESGV